MAARRSGLGSASDRPTASQPRNRQPSRPQQVADGSLDAQVSRLWGDGFAESCDVTVKLPASATTSGSWELRTNTSTIGVRRRVVESESVTSIGTLAPADADYELMGKLGEGGMGTVYAARQAAIGRLIALKMIKPEHAADGHARSKFLAEAVVTGDLDHPNVVPIYDLGMGADGQLFYAMKQVQGEAWSEVMAGKSQAENLEILLRVADAVACAHARGVIHKDLKPQNVMLGSFGEVYVMDWGLAASVDEHGKAMPVADSPVGGTPRYMPPEVALGEVGRIGYASDVYLLGGILYNIVTGEHVHPGEDVRTCLLNAALNVLSPTAAQGELVDIARRALMTDPADRYPDVKSFQASIRSYQAHAQSIDLTRRGSMELRSAKGSGDYQQYARAVFSYEEALATWPENPTAVREAVEARVAYATYALSMGDLDLAAAIMDRPQLRRFGLHRDIQAARAARAWTRRTHRALRVLALSLTGVVIITLATAIVLVWRAKDRAVTAEREKTDAERRKLAIEQQARESLERRGRAWPHYLEGRDLAQRPAKRDAARVAFDQAIAIDPEFRDAIFERAFLLQWTFNDAEGAIADYTRANELSVAIGGKGDSKALRLLGDLWRDRIDGRADPAQALACYEQAAAINPTDPNCRLARILTLEMKGEHATALQLVRTLAEEETGLWEVHYAHGLLLVGYDRGGRSTIANPDWAQAGEAMGKAIKLMPTRNNLYNNRATFLINGASAAGRRLTAAELHRAMQDLSVAVNLDPDTRQPRENRIRLGENYGQWFEVAEDYAYLVTQNPASAAYRTGLGRALVMLGRVDEGLAELQRAQAIVPKDAMVRKIIAWAKQQRPAPKGAETPPVPDGGEVPPAVP
jgi:tetratricopeptide (TPR) repeat protein